MPNEEYWDGDSGNSEERYTGPSQHNTFIRVNNSDRPLDIGQSFVEVVKESARMANMGKFRVFLNDRELRPGDAPDSIEEGMKVELRPYDKAGC
jgi:hypothetical protein